MNVDVLLDWATQHLALLKSRQAITTVQTAMEETTNSDVWSWCRKHLGVTVQSVRRRIAQALAPEQKPKTLAMENR